MEKSKQYLKLARGFFHCQKLKPILKMNWNQPHHWFWHFPYQFCSITIFTRMPPIFWVFLTFPVFFMKYKYETQKQKKLFYILQPVKKRVNPYQEIMTSCWGGDQDGGFQLWRFPLPSPPVNYSHAARCLLHLPLRRSQSTNENARRARQTEATQPLEGRWARLGGFALIREWFIWSCSVHNKVFERGYAGLCPAVL